MHLSKPNVYQTLVLVWRHSRLGLGLPLAINDAASEEISTDTFVQLVSPLLFWLNRNCEIAGSTAFPASRIEKSDESTATGPTL
jgi:hypothetical protein